MVKRIIRKWHVAEVELHVRMNMHGTGAILFVRAVCDCNGFVADVAK